MFKDVQTFNTRPIEYNSFRPIKLNPSEYIDHNNMLPIYSFIQYNKRIVSNSCGIIVSVKKSTSHAENELLDSELDKEFAELVKKGFIEKITRDGQSIYQITSLGDRYCEEVLFKGNKKK